MAIFKADMARLAVRVAQDDEGNFWYDLTDDGWRAVRIDGIPAVKENPPLLFRRLTHQLPQVEPVCGGDISKIFKYVNVKKEYRTLFICWLVSCFVPGIPHPVLVLYGEKGAAKSTAFQFLKALIDPSAIETLAPPGDEKSAIINLSKNWFLPYDNLSHLSGDMSDMLCRAVTGDSIQQRLLYSNSDDVIFKFQRVIGINGISCVATRADLLDRSILLEVERISEENRRELSQIRAEFEADRGEILGGIFDLLCCAKCLYPDVKLDKLPRMADFTRWGYAIGEAADCRGQKFLDQYAANRAAQNDEAIEADPVAFLIVEFMRDRAEWSGTASELLDEIKAIAPKHGFDAKDKAFPRDATRLSKRITAVKSNLEAVGIVCGRGHSGNRALNLKNENIASIASIASKPAKTLDFIDVADENVASIFENVASNIG